ncbi:pilus assembly protein CpaB [Geodermatophilus telluris]|uniref:Pilus assembly protein CpaB n=1 Tax=Geodermatophilus telluris TaxID=1190417 RepID=A0A1G6SIX5_9ACTN|nr:RcpC/CpaB family pilus assembly protein [Geodermatophilus telluris]SDD16106.1 pilus assembly protein CpaB [Geodermatophilus telluris]
MRRLLAALAALLLALVGTVVLVAYVRAADARALAGVETVEVLVVDQPVPEGTPAGDLEDLVRTELLPAKAAAEGRVTDLAELAGRVATADLQPGEQLLAARFGDPAALRDPGSVALPDGAEEVAVLLTPERAAGGRLVAGDTVGVFLSLTYEDGTATTHAVLHRVLVTRVDGGVVPASADTETAAADGEGDAVPTESLLVTLALPASDAETVVFGVEHGTLWLSREPAGADTGGTGVLTQTDVYTREQK